MSKQDRQGARTVSDLERKYGERFADVYGMATGARVAAEEAKEIAAEAKDNPNIDHEAVFNALTEDGKCQGLYRADDGKIYINAEYIKSGVFFGEVEIFLEPGKQEVEKVRKHVEGKEIIPASELRLYDIDGNNVVNNTDLAYFKKVVEDNIPLPNFPAKQLSKVRIEIDVRNTEKAISFSATNMWGRSLDFSIGVNSGIFTDDHLQGLYRIVNGEKEWLSPPMVGGREYRTVERIDGFPVYKKLIVADFDKDGGMTINTEIDFNARRIVGINYHFDDSFNMFPQGSSALSVSISRGGMTYMLSMVAPSYGTYFVEIKYI